MIDGDGAALMHLGSIPMIGIQKYKFIHIIINNQVPNLLAITIFLIKALVLKKCLKFRDIKKVRSKRFRKLCKRN